jgi:hypothetical protein
MKPRTIAGLGTRLLGTALAVAACDPSALGGDSPGRWTLTVLAAAAAWWAAPMVDERPAATTMRWAALALRRRPTLLAAGAVALAAVSGPPVWIGACVTALLAAYLLVTDPWTYGLTAPRPRPPATGRALATAAACAVVFLAAEVPLGRTAWARLPAALAVAATTTCLALALRRRQGVDGPPREPAAAPPPHRYTGGRAR